MTDEQIALARRAVTCRGWRWLRGMLRHDDYRYVGSGVWARWSDTASVMTALHMPDQLPDLQDPATAGCMLALVREAWGSPSAYAMPWGSSPQSQTPAGWSMMVTADDTLPTAKLSAPTEAEALVAALEGAP